jgi:hypothetical protein
MKYKFIFFTNQVMYAWCTCMHAPPLADIIVCAQDACVTLKDEMRGQGSVAEGHVLGRAPTGGLLLAGWVWVKGSTFASALWLTDATNVCSAVNVFGCWACTKEYELVSQENWRSASTFVWAALPLWRFLCDRLTLTCSSMRAICYCAMAAVCFFLNLPNAWNSKTYSWTMQGQSRGWKLGQPSGSTQKPVSFF